MLLLQGGGQPLDGDRFLLLMSAYEVLRSPERRHHYNEMLKLRRSQGSDSAAVVSGFPGPDMGFAATGAEPDAEWQRSSVGAADAEAERWLRWLYEFMCAPAGLPIGGRGGGGGPHPLGFNC